VKVELCKKSLERNGAQPAATLLSALRDREHVPVIRDCLTRCQRCDLGFLIVNVDGMPVGAANGEELLRQLDELAAEDL
jgi:uncharacterized protein YuzB (UPF0349 family)